MSIKKVAVHGQPRFQVRYRDPDGIQRKRNFTSKREAEAFEDAELTNIRRNEWINPQSGATPFTEWANTWLELDPGKRQTTLARDEIIVRMHLAPVFNRRPISSITPMDVQKLVNTWATKYAASTVQRHYRCLAAIFRCAVNSDLILKSPCRAIKLPRAKRKTVALLSGEDVMKLGTELGEYAPMMHIGIVLGLRWGEVAGIRIKDVNILRKTISVDVQVSRDKSGRPLIDEPKTDAGKRTLTVPQSIADELALLLRHRSLSASDTDAFIFSDANGNPIHYSNWRRRVWVPACERAGLPGLGFHDLRRINATAMVVDRVDIKTAQARLGHADPRMTLAIYAQATSEGDAFAARQLGQRFLRTTSA